VVLVENAMRAQAVIRENIAATRLPGVQLLGMSATGAIKTLAGEKFDVVFMDPPNIEDPVPVVEAIAEADLIVPDGRVVVEHRVDRKLPDRIGPFELRKCSTYADAALSIYALAAE
jgi:16S rRNA G966 N2-methylase RsmD